MHESYEYLEQHHFRHDEADHPIDQKKMWPSWRLSRRIRPRNMEGALESGE